MSPLVLDRDRDDNMADITESDIAAMEDEVADSNSESLADRLLLAYRAALTQPHTPKLNPLEQPGTGLQSIRSPEAQIRQVRPLIQLLNNQMQSMGPLARILTVRRSIQLLKPTSHPSTG
jgi:hypothetical protein